MKKEYLIPANPGLMPTEKWERCRNTDVRSFLTKPRCFLMKRSVNRDCSKLKARIAKVRMRTLFGENEDLSNLTWRRDSPLHAKKTFEGVASFKPRPLYVQVKRCRCLLHRLVGPQSRYRRRGEDKGLLPCRESNHVSAVVLPADRSLLGVAVNREHCGSELERETRRVISYACTEVLLSRKLAGTFLPHASDATQHFLP